MSPLGSKSTPRFVQLNSPSKPPIVKVFDVFLGYIEDALSPKDFRLCCKRKCEILGSELLYWKVCLSVENLTLQNAFKFSDQLGTNPMNLDKSCMVLDFSAFVFPLSNLKIELFLLTKAFKLLYRRRDMLSCTTVLAMYTSNPSVILISRPVCLRLAQGLRFRF
jgi:hypothetical protein